MWQNGGCLGITKNQQKLKQEYLQVVCDCVPNCAQYIAAKALVRRSWGIQLGGNIRINRDALLEYFPANNAGYWYILAVIDYFARNLYPTRKRYTYVIGHYNG